LVNAAQHPGIQLVALVSKDSCPDITLILLVMVDIHLLLLKLDLHPGRNRFHRGSQHRSNLC
jgi:hypothetical protein